MKEAWIMGYDLLISFIEQVGYVALFLVLCLGLIGLPIPNETVVMTGGALAAAEVLDPGPAYLMTFLGICSAMTFSYSVGRFAGSKLSTWFQNQKNISRFLARSEALSEKYGGYAICMSLFLPFVRHATPYVVGMNRLPFKRFILFAYPSAFVWTSIYFIIGSLVGDQAQEIADVIYHYGLYILIALCAVAALYFLYRYTRTKEKKSDIERHM